MKKMILNFKHEGNGFSIWGFVAETSRPNQNFVVKVPSRGMIAVTQFSERMKVIDFLQGRKDDLDDIMGVPATDHEEAYSRIPDSKAAAVINRVMNLTSVK